MNKFDRLSELLFNRKTDTFPWDEVNNDPDIISNLDQSVEIGGMPHAILIVSNDLMKSCKWKFERELNESWFISWSEVRSFVYKILEHFGKKIPFFIENDFIPFLLADGRLANKPFEIGVLRPTDSKKYDRIFRLAVISNIFQLSIPEEEKLHILSQCIADKLFNWIKLFFEQTKANNVAAHVFAKYLIASPKTDARDEILRIVLCGLASADIKRHYKFVKSVLEINGTRALAISAFSCSATDDPDFLSEIIDLVEKNSTRRLEEQVQIIRMYFAFLGGVLNRHPVNVRCEEAILSFCETNDQTIFDLLLNNLSLELQSETFVYACLLRVAGNELTSKRYYEAENFTISRFDDILRHVDPKSSNFLNFLREFVIKTGLNYNNEILQHSLNQKFAKDSRQNRRFLIDCLIDDIGRVRYLGNVLLELYIDIFPKTDFKKELLALKGDRMVILIFSIRYYLPFKFAEKFKLVLIPIMNIKDELVNSMLVKIIVSMMRDFPSIISMLEEGFGSDESWKETLDTLKGYRDQVSNLAWEKISVQELSPAITHSYLYGLHQKIYTRRFKEDITQSAWEKSFLSKMASRIYLLKGGGWKMESANDQTVQKLGRHETSITVPTYIFRNPEKDQLHLSQYFSVDFKSNNDLQEWLIRFSYENI